MTPIWGRSRLPRRFAAIRALMNIGACACPRLQARRNHYVAPNELSRLCLGVLRTAGSELLSTDEVAGKVIVSKGFDQSDEFCAQRYVIRSARPLSGYIGIGRSRMPVHGEGANGGLLR
jgi:hypothetical protein